MRPVTDCVLDVAINLGGLREGLIRMCTVYCLRKRVNRVTVNERLVLGS